MTGTARLFDDGDEGAVHVGHVRTRALTDLAGCADREQPAGVLDRDSIAVLRFLHEVRRDDDGDPLLGQRGDGPPEGATRQRVDAARRLVEEEDVRLVEKPRGHREALFVAPGQISAASCSGQSELLQGRGDTRLKHPAAESVRATEELEVRPHAQVSVERELLRDVSNARAGLGPRRAQVHAGHFEMTAGGR